MQKHSPEVCNRAVGGMFSCPIAALVAVASLGHRAAVTSARVL